MGTVPKPEVSIEHSKIAAVRQNWIQAVNDGDVSRLANYMTDDVVAVRRDGRCASGKDVLAAGLLEVFRLYDVERRILRSEVTVRDNWSFEIDEMDSTATPLRHGNEIHAHVKTVLVYARQADGSWKVARLLELVD